MTTPSRGPGVCAFAAALLPWLLPVPAAHGGAAGPAPRLEAAIRAETLTAAGKVAAALTRDPALQAIAAGHSADMFRQRALGHVLDDGVGPAQRVARGHRWLFALVSENVAYQRHWPAGDDLALRFVEGWMESPGHRKNILAAYDALEVGCHGNRTTMYCTQLFVRASARLDTEVAFRQRAGAQLELRLAAAPVSAAPETGAPETGGGERRISVAAPGAPTAGVGVTVEGGRALVDLPAEPGLYQLRYWTQDPQTPLRFHIVPGPYLCVITPAPTPDPCAAISD